MFPAANADFVPGAVLYGDDTELPRAAFQALTAGEPEKAFAYADRLCRIATVVEPLHLLLRGQALAQLGHDDFASRDALAVLEIEPQNIAAARLLMNCGEEKQAEQAARIIAETAPLHATLSQALSLLSRAGEPGWAQIWWQDGALRGWAAWRPGVDAMLVIHTAEGIFETPLIDQFDHPLHNAFGHATPIALPIEACRAKIYVRLDAKRYGLLRLTPPPEPAALPSTPSEKAGTVTIIIPVYDDSPATKRCIESVIAHRPYGCRVIIVDDESPDPDIARYLDELNVRNVEVLRNPFNQGFVGTVNRGIAAVADGDILLLNADTIVPKHFIQRLRAAAYSAPDIGTVVPLSNNGEFVSFPKPFVANPLTNSEQADPEIGVLDSAANFANGTRVIDLPSGIGFCLYVTARCLADVPRLSEGWGRGYLEDADYCLRARTHGWRNVCATGVFVGHHGSRSFKEEKRSLVVSNARRLAARFPYYRTECSSFVSADPLREARGRVERRLSRHQPVDRLFVAGPRLARLATVHISSNEHGISSLLMSVEPGGQTVSIRDARGGVPQSLQFKISDPDLSAYLRERSIGSYELVGLEPLPQALWTTLVRARKPMSLFVATTRHMESQPTQQEVGWHALMEQSILGSIVAADDIVAANMIAAGLSPNEIASHFRSPLITRESVERGRTILIVMPEIDSSAFQLVHALIMDLRERGSTRPIVIFGRTTDDWVLMSHLRVQVVGPVPPAEIKDVSQLYKAGVVVLPDHFSSATLEVVCVTRLDLPVAYFAPSECETGLDLCLDPGHDVAHNAAHIAAWVEQQIP